MTALVPGPVPSEFQTRAGFTPGFDSAVLNVSAPDVAAAGYRGLMAGKRAVLPGLGIKILPLLLRLVPREVVLSASSPAFRVGANSLEISDRMATIGLVVDLKGELRFPPHSVLSSRRPKGARSSRTSVRS